RHRPSHSVPGFSPLVPGHPDDACSRRVSDRSYRFARHPVVVFRFLREVARILAVLYGSPNLGNKQDPTDELVYILLARHTREGAYQQAFDLLKKRFRTWDDVLKAPRRQVEKLVYSGGLSGKKTTALYAALGKLCETFGHCTLAPARDWPDEQLEAF